MGLHKLQFSIGVSVYGEAHLQYLHVLLQSLNVVYSDRTNPKIQVLYQNVSQRSIDDMRHKMPSVKYTECKKDFGKLTIPGKLNFWNELVKQAENRNILLIDADTAVIRDVSAFFDWEYDYDIGYTYKTEESENLNWPLNTGVIFVRRNKKSLAFFERWTEYTNSVISDGRKIGLFSKGWGAVDQATLGIMLDTRDKGRYAQEIRIGDIICTGFECKILNETRCVPLDKAYIVHYKGRWREVIPEGTFTIHRPKEKCSCQFQLWKDMLKQWSEL